MARPPAAWTMAAISGPSQAMATGPSAAAWAMASICRIMGRPAMRASGLPGRRVEAMRAGMRIIGFMAWSGSKLGTVWGQ